MKAILALENGIWYEGESAGAPGETGGEVVFNTSMTGYQEVLTDPSYSGQIVTMTCPEIGNYGVAGEDVESRGSAGGRLRRSATESPMASNWRADGTLRDYLMRNNIVAISDIDTRALTRVLRSAGRHARRSSRPATSIRDALVDRARALRADGRLGSGARRDLRRRRSTGSRPTARRASSRRSPERRAGRPLNVAAYDFGMKWNILRRFTALRLRRPGVPGDGAGIGAARDESRRRVPQQRPRRSGGARLRDRQRAGR